LDGTVAHSKDQYVQGSFQFDNLTEFDRKRLGVNDVARASSALKRAKGRRLVDVISNPAE
jgi:hypothetical protein